MVDAVVSVLLDQLLSIIRQQVEPDIRLVMGVENEVSNLESNLQAVSAVLVDAEKRQLKEIEVRRWLDELKDVSYESTMYWMSGALPFSNQFQKMEFKLLNQFPRRRYASHSSSLVVLLAKPVMWVIALT